MALDNVRTGVEQGYSLSKEFDKHIGFSPAIIGLIEQGEQSGNLPYVFDLARTILEREDTLIKTCMGALAYPVIIGIFAFVLTLGLMRGVMPQIIPLLKSMHVTLPLITRIVMYISEHVFIYGLYILVGSIIFLPIAIVMYKKISLFRRCCHFVFIRIIIIGKLSRYYNLSLTMRSLGSLILSGSSMTDSYARVANRMTYFPFKTYFNSKILFLSQGGNLASIFSGFKHIPAYVAPLITAGEASGTLGTSLMRSADILNRDIEQSLKRLTALIEPVMMIGIGCVVGAIAVSIMMPIYDMSKALQH